MNATLTQSIKRPETQNERKVDFCEWMMKIKSKFYANNPKMETAINKIN